MTAKDLFGVLVRWTGFLGFVIGLLLIIREITSRWLAGMQFAQLDWAYSLEPGVAAMLLGLLIMGCARVIASLAYMRDPKSN